MLLECHEKAQTLVHQNLQFSGLSRDQGIELEVFRSRCSQFLNCLRVLESHLWQFALRLSALDCLTKVDAFQLGLRPKLCFDRRIWVCDYSISAEPCFVVLPLVVKIADFVKLEQVILSLESSV